MSAVLVTGANGLLGSALCARLRTLGRPVLAWTRPEADLAHPSLLREPLLRAAPAAVVHCAAWTDVDRAEDEPTLCRTINVDASAALAAAAKEAGASFVYVSSGGIFAGTKPAPYDEDDPPAPRTVYHRSKHDGELAVRARHDRALVVRLGWIFGGGPDQRKNFVAARLREAAGRECIFSSLEQHGSPTWCDDAARRLVELLDAGATGLCHVANEGMVSRLEYVTAILALAGRPTRVEPAPSGAFARRADVPANEALTSIRLAGWRLAPLRPWREALAEYLRQTVP